jgi:hypothetical protein
MTKGLAIALVALGGTAVAPAGPDVQCPPSFKQAVGACDPSALPGGSCTYPEGHCECVRSIPCSGVPHPPGEPQWRCQQKRTDGCPDAQPAPGAACMKPGKKCSYGSCGAMELTCEAKTRKWVVSGVVAPPPSRPDAGAPPRPIPATNEPAWKRCPAHHHFGCEPRSQGIAPAPGETIPEVCGCLPTCPSFRSVLIAQEAEGRWPDGTRKGRFTCARDGIP